MPNAFNWAEERHGLGALVNLLVNLGLCPEELVHLIIGDRCQAGLILAVPRERLAKRSHSVSPRA